MIAAENLSKSYGGQLLLDGVSFQINPRERIGLVGRNGHGKTTLFRILAGETPPDAGAIAVPKGYRMGYVKQELAFTEATILAEGMKGLAENERDARWKVEKILDGLGFSREDLYRPPQAFSGGFQVRLNLAKALVAEPDLLLLDEPTNYLDITSIRWVVRFLNNWPRELMLITHDRGFMDQVVTHILGIHRHKVRKISGTTEKYYAQVAQDEEVYEKTRINDERRRKEVELFISRFRAKARLANLVQSRIKTLSKMEKKEKLQTLRTLDFSFRAKSTPAKLALSVRGLNFAFPGGQPLIRDLDLTVLPGDRVCVIGRNGKGKTTLLKALAGRLPAGSGEIVYHPDIVPGFFEQTHVSELIDERTVEEEILYAHPDVDRQTARNICGAMMFSGDEALKKVAVLSGGEKSRVMLGKILATPVNLLLLDEPTNHLDMDASDALLAALDEFPGAVIMVTHNEMFLHALAQKLVVFQGNGPFVFDGGYQRFLEKVGWGEEGLIGKTRYPSEKTEAPAPVRIDRKTARKLRSEILAERAAALRPVERRIGEVETRIQSAEAELARLNEAVVAASQAREGKRISEISRQIHRSQAAADRLYDELEHLTDRQDSLVAGFQERIDRLDAEAVFVKEDP